MSIVPMCNLSAADVRLLGNNLTPSMNPRRRRRQLAAVNRSLAPHQEEVSKLFRPLGVLAPTDRLAAIQ